MAIASYGAAISVSPAAPSRMDADIHDKPADAGDLTRHLEAGNEMSMMPRRQQMFVQQHWETSWSRQQKPW